MSQLTLMDQNPLIQFYAFLLEKETTLHLVICSFRVREVFRVVSSYRKKTIMDGRSGARTQDLGFIRPTL